MCVFKTLTPNSCSDPAFASPVTAPWHGDRSGRSSWRGLAWGPEAATSWRARPSGPRGCSFARAPGPAWPGRQGCAGRPALQTSGLHPQEREGGSVDVRGPPRLGPRRGFGQKARPRGPGRLQAPLHPHPPPLVPGTMTAAEDGAPGPRLPGPLLGAVAPALRPSPRFCRSVGALATRPRAAASRAREPWARGPLVSGADRTPQPRRAQLPAGCGLERRRPGQSFR